MNDKKGRDIFYAVVAIATLIIAMIGATLAYFSITASSGEGAINAKSAVVTINYNDGEQIMAQADMLIPSKFGNPEGKTYDVYGADDVVITAYERGIKNRTHQDYEDEIAANEGRETPLETKCRDDNGKQVCSSYRFSISSGSTSGIEMLATLNVDLNTFETLSGTKLSLGYALYHVTNLETGAGEWMPMLTNSAGEKQYYNLMNESCNDADELVSNCHNADGSYVASQILPLFGMTESAAGAYSNNKFTITNTTETYDLVIFLYDNGELQNADQGKEFSGTLKVSLADDEANKISGYIAE